MKETRFSYHIIITISVLVLFSCNRTNQVRFNNDRDHQLLHKQMGKKIDLVSLMNKEERRQKKILIYKNTDCRKCLDQCYYILKSTSSFNDSCSIIKVGIKEEFDNKYSTLKKEIHYDSCQIIKNQLGYIPTPVILTLENYTITNYKLCEISLMK